MQLHRPYQSALMGLVIVSIILVGSCTTGPGSAPEDTIPAPLMGSWQTLFTNTRSDGVTGVVTVTLTLTKSRFVRHAFIVWDDDETTLSRADSGTWTSTDTTITKIAHIRNEETGASSAEPVTVVKNYVWGDAERNTLHVHLWDRDVPTTRFERYTRLEPIPGGIMGVWRSSMDATKVYNSWQPAEGAEALGHWTLSVGDTFIEDISPYSDSDVAFTLTGDLKRHDPDEGFLFIAATGVDGEPAPSDIYVGHELKFAYAKTGPNTIIVSTFRDELAFNEDEMMWVDQAGPDAFGRYWLILEK